MFQKLDVCKTLCSLVQVQRLRLALSKGPNKVFPTPHLRTETDPVSETLFSLVFRIPDDGQGYRSGGPGSIPGTTRKKKK
jgi:hypothetical protein